MDRPRPFRIVESASAATRVQAAIEFLDAFPARHPVTIVAATRGAADDLARAVAVARGATFGTHRLSLTQLAARAAIVELARQDITVGTGLAAEAVATRAVFDALRAATVRYFEPVAAAPGFPRALAATLQQLRLGEIDRTRLQSAGPAGPDLADLLARFEENFVSVGTVDRAALYRIGARVLVERPIGGALVLLDVPLQHAAERELVAAAVGGATAICTTVPEGDRLVVEALTSLGGILERSGQPGDGDLAALRRYLFSATAQPPVRDSDGSLQFFSAPGEGRECVEIARRVLAEARRGITFDEIAVLVRSPRNYFGLLEHALGRAGIPGWFDRGTRRPHPAGRAFLALLACAAEQMSASRFAEYLSLGQVPQEGLAPDEWRDAGDEILAGRFGADEPESEEAGEGDTAGSAEDGVVAGTLRAPWRWERLLLDAAVIGQGADRWRRRLQGYEQELLRQRASSVREEGDGGGRVRALDLTLDQLRHLQTFALPIVEELERWPRQAPWGDWLRCLEALVPRVLRAPGQVLRVLADLRPMAAVGPIDLDEARRVLADRLLTLESDPPARRFGRVFVGTPQQARGRSFRVVFVPGLAERMFPQKPREDPLLLDAARAMLSGTLPTQDARLAEERLLLQVAAGAASDRLYVSYPRIELSEARARVPSFYALDLMRAVTGRVPDHEWLEERARLNGNAMLSWPAPARADDAIDDQEHDLAVLRRLLDDRNQAAVRGRAHYLLSLNDHLRRSVVARWARVQPRWSAADGLVATIPHTMAALGRHRLAARDYSLSTLQKFAACPYQFVLAAMYRLQPQRTPEPLQRMDPMTRGSLFHDMQARCLRALRAHALLPLTTAALGMARQVLEDIINAVADGAHQELAPAVERVWDDEIAAIRRDLHVWLGMVADEGDAWEPKYFEYAFGTVPGERDEHSRSEPAVLLGGYRLRGAVDVIEQHRTRGQLRVTDHKTGRRPEGLDRLLVGGGAVLQPVLYALAVEATLKTTVESGRLFFCTATGGFATQEIALTERAREAGLEVLAVIDRAVESGFLVAAPSPEACGRCDYRPVCGPGVWRRTQRKPHERLADLVELRSRP